MNRKIDILGTIVILFFVTVIFGLYFSILSIQERYGERSRAVMQCVSSISNDLDPDQIILEERKCYSSAG